MKLLTILLLVFTGAVHADGMPCVFPVPDGGDVMPSPPSIAGVLTAAGPTRVIVRASSGSYYTVLVSSSTQLFTAYGGGFEAEELRAGQHAIIWLDNCAAPSKVNRAAILQVCSLASEPCLD